MVVVDVLGPRGGWLSGFMLVAAATTFIIPLVAAFLSESIDALIARRPANALSGINRTLGRLGHAPVDALPPPPSEVVKPSIASLFSSRYARITIQLTTAY